MRKLWIGVSLLPMLFATGCGVPATLKQEEGLLLEVKQTSYAWGGGDRFICKNGDLYLAPVSNTSSSTVGYAGTLDASQMDRLKKNLGSQSFDGKYIFQTDHAVDADYEIVAHYFAADPSLTIDGDAKRLQQISRDVSDLFNLQHPPTDMTLQEAGSVRIDDWPFEKILSLKEALAGKSDARMDESAMNAEQKKAIQQARSLFPKNKYERNAQLDGPNYTFEENGSLYDVRIFSETDTVKFLSIIQVSSVKSAADLEGIPGFKPGLLSGPGDKQSYPHDLFSVRKRSDAQTFAQGGKVSVRIRGKKILVELRISTMLKQIPFKQLCQQSFSQ